MLHFINHKELINLTKKGDKKFIGWLVVIGENETDAIVAARHILKTFWSKYLEQNTS